MLGSPWVEMLQWGWGSWVCDFGCESCEGAAGGHCGQKIDGEARSLMQFDILSRMRLNAWFPNGLAGKDVLGKDDEVQKKFCRY